MIVALVRGKLRAPITRPSVDLDPDVLGCKAGVEVGDPAEVPCVLARLRFLAVLS